MCANADIFGTTFDWRRRFWVSSVGSRRWHQRERGNLSSTPARIAMKCALKVWMACSTWFHLWLPGGTSSNWISCLRIYCLSASDALLSNVCFFIPSPAILILLIIFSYALIVGRDPKVLRRVSRILIKEGLHFANLFYIFE